MASVAAQAHDRWCNMQAPLLYFSKVTSGCALCGIEVSSPGKGLVAADLLLTQPGRLAAAGAY